MNSIRYIVLITAVFMLGIQPLWARSGGPPDGYAGNPPGENSCVECHSTFGLNTGNGSLSLLGLPDAYVTGETYRLAIRLADPNARRWGFELTALDSGNDRAGTIARADSQNTQISGGNAPNPQYIKQTSNGTHAGQADSSDWGFDWTAPQGDIGSVTFYLAGNAANNNNSATGDRIYAISESRTAAEPSPPPDSILINLVEGWNLVSSPVIPLVANLDSIFSVAVASGDVLLIRNLASQIWKPAANIREFTDWDTSAALQIRMANPATVAFYGEFADPSTHFILQNGWNWIAYPRLDSLFVTEALAGLGESLTMAKGNSGRIYVPAQGFNELGYIHPGEAWKILVTAGAPVDFVWVSAQEHPNAPAASPECRHFSNYPNTGRSLNLLVAQWEQTVPHPGDEVAAFYSDGGGVSGCGAAVVQDGLFNLIAWGDDNSTDDFQEGPLDGDLLTFRYWSSVADSEFNIGAAPLDNHESIGFINDDLIQIKLIGQPSGVSSGERGGLLPGDTGLVGIYPNPFNAAAVASYELRVASRIKLVLYDLSGRLAMDLADEWQSAGKHQVAINGAGLASGEYLVELQAGGNRSLSKVVLMR